MTQSTNKTQEVITQINKAVDKAQSETAAIQEKGFKSYFWSRKVSMKLGVFVIVVISALVLGVVVGW
jgi:t-SNARE complex subunit (syntaxin)